jgi:hypothetical protein
MDDALAADETIVIIGGTGARPYRVRSLIVRATIQS